MTTDRRGLLAVAIALGLSACGSRPMADEGPLTVFAAASLTDVLTELARAFEAETGRSVRLSFASSGAVARQIDAGAPADVIVLADQPWMDHLASSGRIRSGSRVDLLGNRLVMIAAPSAGVDGDPLDWLARTGGRLVIGDPDSVPAGAYARAWLQGQGRWDAVQSRLATAADVRAVRTFVIRGEAALGIVYRSDVIGVDGLKVVAEPPPDQQPRIVYPAALGVGAASAAEALLDFLRSARAGAVFERYGFSPLIEP